MTAEQPRILLADDEDTFRLSTATLLRAEGYQCDCAQDSEEASRLLTNAHDALISDIRMPGNTQLEFLREVRDRFPALPIVVVTGYPSVQTAVESLRLSFADYLLKPVEWPDLLRSVTQAVEKSRVLRATEAARQEVGRLVASLDRLKQRVAEPGAITSAKDLAWSLDVFLAQSAVQLAALSADVRAVMTGYLHGVDRPTDVCRLMQCPRQTAYRAAIDGAIDVLERTKHAFKSKDLGELRRKLEQLLKESDVVRSGGPIAPSNASNAGMLQRDRDKHEGGPR